MSIIPGTTPTLTMQLDMSVASCTAAEFCLVCGKISIIRKLPSLTISEDGMKVSIKLTQAETLQIPDNQVARVQLRVLLNGTAMATDVIPVSTRELLHRKELVADGD